jgi:hypothetical protein
MFETLSTGKCLCGVKVVVEICYYSPRYFMRPWLRNKNSQPIISPLLFIETQQHFYNTCKNVADFFLFLDFLTNQWTLPTTGVKMFLSVSNNCYKNIRFIRSPRHFVRFRQKISRACKLPRHSMIKR